MDTTLIEYIPLFVYFDMKSTSLILIRLLFLSGNYVQKNIELYTVKSHIFKIITIILKIIGIRERILATLVNTTVCWRAFIRNEDYG